MLYTGMHHFTVQGVKGSKKKTKRSHYTKPLVRFTPTKRGQVSALAIANYVSLKKDATWLQVVVFNVIVNILMFIFKI